MENWPALSFHDRQRLWTGFTRSFVQNNGRGKRPSVWTISVQGDRVTTVFGVEDGQMQRTDYVGKAKNVGRANAITSEVDALAEARRDIRKKWDYEGYDEVWNNVNIDKRNQDVSIQHLLTSLPGSFCLYKPENNFWDKSCKKLLEKAREGTVWYTLKRDGMAKLIVVDYYGNIQIYSRRARAYHKDEGPKELPDGTLDHSNVIPWSARFPHLVEAVKGLGLPPGTMIAGELVWPRNAGDDFKYASSITKSLTPQAISDMQMVGLPFFYWWDMPFFNGEDWVSTKYVQHRIHHMRRIWDAAGVNNGGVMDPAQTQNWIVPLHIETFITPEAALEKAKELGIEGWVVVDPSSIYGDKGWNLKGKPDRPSTSAKLKPKEEDDFVAMWDPDNDMGEWGTGKHEKDKLVTLPDGSQVRHGGVGSIALCQYNTDGDIVFICNCSSGMDFAFQAKLTKASFPFVCKVEYPERTYISDGEKTNALRHPVFLGKREDKTAAECVNERL